MNKPEEILELIKGLSELEMLELLEGVGDHLQKTKTEHLIDKVFEVDETDDLNISDLEDQISELEDDRDQAYAKLNKVKWRLAEIQELLV